MEKNKEKDKKKGEKKGEINVLTRFSYSGISTFRQCPRAFQYRYIDELPSAFTSIEAHMGSSVHTALEWAYRERMEGREADAVLEHYKQAFWDSDVLETVKIIKDDGKLAGDYFQQGKEMLMSFLKRVFAVEPHTTLLLEQTFVVNLSEEIRFKGIIDRVARGKDGVLRIIDYKTGRAGHPLDNLQLPSYALYVFENNIDPEIILCIEDLREGCSREARFRRQEVKKVRAQLLEDIALIHKTETFVPKPSVLCRWCGYNHICPEARTGSKAPPVKTDAAASVSGDTCPQCGSKLVQRNGKFGPFFGCSSFPRCRYTRQP